MLAFAVSTLCLAAPPSGLPKLVDRGSFAIQEQWKEVKTLKDPAAQAARIKERSLDRVRCTDLLPLTEALRHARLPLRLRDTVRFRVQARPEMIALVAKATSILMKTAPGAVITIGDVAQPGCGQIKFGDIVGFVDKDEGEALRKDARWRFGELGTFEAMSPADFIDEHPRFVDTLGPIWVERTLTGVAADGATRVETRRFDAGKRLGDGSVLRLLERTRKRLSEKGRVVRDRVRHALEDGKVARVLRAVWRDPREQRFVEVLWRPGAAGVTRAALLRIREARTDLKKPTSLIDEERYLFEYDGEAGVRVDRLNLLYEAQHVSHLAGFDADLSFVTAGNVGAFEPSSALIDPRGTWEWMRALDEGARQVGVPLRDLFVDKSILRMLRAQPFAKRSDPVWKKLHASPGHDSHVHVRIGASTRFGGKTGEQILEIVGLD